MVPHIILASPRCHPVSALPKSFWHRQHQQNVRLCSLATRAFGMPWNLYKPTRPATSSYSHHLPTEGVEKCTPFCDAASSNGALPTPSYLSEHYVHYSVTWRNSHDTSAVTLGQVMSCYADGGRILELHISLVQTNDG